ncbi:substrate-binding domain-containing protein [Streptomyces sp. NPDC048442]|uniref:substrate-binding domain-containing protein n=1 Tax=Streptomyces sp. NPDC048442 TaxID=3154823 RepID=UPI0034133CFB
MLTGARIPFAVTGFNDLPLCTLLQPALTSVRLPLPAIAHALVDRLITAVEQPAAAPTTGLLLPRGSLSCAAAHPTRQHTGQQHTRQHTRQTSGRHPAGATGTSQNPEAAVSAG